MIRVIREAKMGRAVLFVTGLVVATVAALIISFWPAKVHASTQADIKVAAAAKVLNVTAWAFDQSGPPPWSGKDDVYSVTVRNPSAKNSGLNQVSFVLTSRNHGQPSTVETILVGSSGFFLTAKPPTWVVNLAPGRTTTVFFMTRSVGDDQYCAGVRGIPVLMKCTPHG